MWGDVKKNRISGFFQVQTNNAPGCETLACRNDPESSPDCIAIETSTKTDHRHGVRLERFSPARATSAFLNKRLSSKIAQSANRAVVLFCGSGPLCGCAFLEMWFAHFRKTRRGFGCLLFLANLSFWGFELWRKVELILPFWQKNSIKILAEYCR